MGKTQNEAARKVNAQDAHSAAPMTQRDIARLAGVSQSVVSRVLGGSGYVSEEARAKVVSASDRSGYVLDAGARSLVTGRSNIIPLITSNVTNSFYPYLFDKLALAVQAGGREVMLFNAAGGRDVDELLPALRQYRVRAAVVFAAALSSRFAAQMLARGVQVVMLNRYSLDLASSTVACDNVGGGRTVADAFFRAGFTRVAYVGGGATASTNRDRRTGFVEGLERHGLELAYAENGSFTRDWGLRAAADLIVIKGLQGIFCADDDIAMGVADRLRFDFGMRIPDDVAVVGFDDVPGASWPPYNLTTVRQPVEDMVARTLELLEEPHSGRPTHVRIPGELIRRGTF